MSATFLASTFTVGLSNPAAAGNFSAVWMVIQVFVVGSLTVAGLAWLSENQT